MATNDAGGGHPGSRDQGAGSVGAARTYIKANLFHTTSSPGLPGLASK